MSLIITNLQISDEQRLAAYKYALEHLNDRVGGTVLSWLLEEWAYGEAHGCFINCFPELLAQAPASYNPEEHNHESWWPFGGPYVERGRLERKIVLLKAIKQVKLLIEAKDLL